jgi:hypothetical protein
VTMRCLLTAISGELTSDCASADMHDSIQHCAEWLPNRQCKSENMVNNASDGAILQV